MLGESCHTSSAVGSIFVASSRTRLAPVARPVQGKMRPTVTITPQAIPKAFSFGVPIRSRSHGSTPSCVTSPPNCCRSARPRSIRTAWFSSLSLPAVWWAASTDRIEMGWLWSDPAGPSKVNSLGPTHENQGWWCPETAGHSPTTPVAPVIEACHRGGPRSRFDHGLLAFLSVPFATSSAVEGIQIGQSAKSLRSSIKFHPLGTSKATWWARRFGVGPVCAFVTHDTVLANASERGRRLYWARALPMSGWRLNFWQSVRSERAASDVH